MCGRLLWCAHAYIGAMYRSLLWKWTTLLPFITVLPGLLHLFRSLVLSVVCLLTQAAEKAAEEEAKRTNILTAGRGKQNLDADVLVVPRDLLRGRTRRSHMGKVLSVSLSATRRVFKQAKERAIARRRQDASSVKVLNEEAGAQEDERRWSLSGATHIPEHKLIAVACDDCTVTLWRDDTYVVVGNFTLVSVPAWLGRRWLLPRCHTLHTLLHAT